MRCAHGLCNSDSRYKNKDYMKNVEFIPFIKPEHNLKRCNIWIDACGRKNFSISNVSKNTYICTKHFVGGNGPTKENPDPISVTKEKENLNVKKRTPIVKNRKHLKEEIVVIQNISLLQDSAENKKPLKSAKEKIIKLKMDENSSTDETLNRKRELARARSKRYREKKREEAKQHNKKIKRSRSERQKEISRERTRRYRAKKRLSAKKNIEHDIHHSEVSGYSNYKPPPLMLDPKFVQVKQEINEEFIIKEELDIFETDLQGSTCENSTNDFCVKEEIKEMIINENSNTLGNVMQDLKYEDTSEDFYVKKETEEVLIKQEWNEDVNDVKYQDTEVGSYVKEEINEELNCQERDPLEHCSEVNIEFQK